MADVLDVIVVGAGPTGLACGIEAVRARMSLLVLEKGCLVNSIFHYPANMTFFTTRERLEIGEIPFSSINLKPTRAEAMEYYRRVTDFYHLPVRYEEEVINIASLDGTFQVETRCKSESHRTYTSRKVIIATGYYDRPNFMGIPGEDLPKVSHYATEGHAFYGRKVAVIGGANSAAITALDLFRHGAEVTVIYRGSELSRHIKYWVRPDIENRIKEKSIHAFFNSQVTEITWDSICIRTGNGEDLQVPNDFVFALTGYHPDVDLLRRAGVEVDPKTYCPVSDSKTLESNVPGLYLAGVLISGRRTNEIFIENGRFHGKVIIDDIKQSGDGAQ
jgi:bacillithiol disulfide reductase